MLFGTDIISYQLKLIKMRAELANINDCAVPFLSRAAVNFCWYDYTTTRAVPVNSVQIVYTVQCTVYIVQIIITT